jgi:hypothetical protein
LNLVDIGTSDKNGPLLVINVLGVLPDPCAEQKGKNQFVSLKEPNTYFAVKLVSDRVKVFEDQFVKLNTFRFTDRLDRSVE